MTYKEAVDYLYSLIPPITGTLYPGDIGFERARRLMEELGNPQDTYPTIHIAGTAGKGSTTYMTASILKAAGYKVGHHVSPHVVSIRERIQVDMDMISKEDFVQAVERVKPAVEAVSGGKMEDGRDMGDVTYFEALNGVTFEYFRLAGVDVAVIETGLGGLVDATNVVSSLVSVITPIGFDHEKVLGSTIEQIAENKAGIIKESNTYVISAAQRDDARVVIDRVADEKAVKSQFLGENFHVSEYSMYDSGVQFMYTNDVFEVEMKDVKVALVGQHQMENAACAISAVLAARKTSAGKNALNQVDEEAIRKGLASVVIPGRFEKLEYKGRTVILDGAHNPDKVGALVKAVSEVVSMTAGSKSNRIPALLAFKKGKNMKNMLTEFKKVVSDVAFSQFWMQTDLGKGKDMSTPIEDIVDVANEVGLNVIFAERHPEKAFEKLLDETSEIEGARMSGGTGDQPILVSGSFFLVSEIRAYILKNS